MPLLRHQPTNHKKTNQATIPPTNRPINLFECTKCKGWLYATGWEYVETTGVFLLGTFDMLPGGALCNSLYILVPL